MQWAKHFLKYTFGFILLEFTLGLVANFTLPEILRHGGIMPSKLHSTMIFLLTPILWGLFQTLNIQFKPLTGLPKAWLIGLFSLSILYSTAALWESTGFYYKQITVVYNKLRITSQPVQVNTKMSIPEKIIGIIFVIPVNLCLIAIELTPLFISFRFGQALYRVYFPQRSPPALHHS